MISHTSLGPRAYLLMLLVAASIAVAGLTYTVTSHTSKPKQGEAVAGVQYRRPADPGTERGQAPSFSGDVDGLAPGVELMLLVEIRNDNPFAITLTELAVVPADASDQCGAELVQTEPYAERRVVAARSTAVQEVPITLLSSAPDACKNVQFPLTYTGTAVKS